MNRKGSLIEREDTDCIFNSQRPRKINVYSDKKFNGTDKKDKLDEETLRQHNIGNVNINVLPENVLHLGTLIIVNGPATFREVSRNVLMNIKTNCKCKNSKKDLRLNLRRKNKETVKTGDNILHRWNLKKCILLGFIITITEILGLFLYFVFFSKNSESYLTMKDVKRLNDMKINLKRFVQRPSFGMDDQECSYQCYIQPRSRIKFHIPLWSSWFDCLVKSERCEPFLMDEFRHHRSKPPFPLNDIYYNYLVSMRGVVYEARLLSCPFDDEHLVDDDHSSVITIGIAYCFPGNGENNKYYSLNVFKAVEDLLQKLLETGFLKEKFTMEFPSICNNSLLSNFAAETRAVSFYKLENTFNYSSSLWNPEMIRNLLFLSEGRNMSGIPSVIRQNVLNPSTSAQNNRFNNCKNSSEIKFIEGLNKFDKITIKYTNRFQSFNSYCINATDCFRMVKGFSNQEPLKSRSFNYFIHLASSFVFKGVPLNCSIEENQENKEISILIIFPSLDNRPDKYINLFSNLLLQVVKDIKQSINYREVSFDIFCDSELSPIMHVYEILMNDVYVTSKGFRVSTHRECNRFSG